jgi:hypothetical protein
MRGLTTLAAALVASSAVALNNGQARTPQRESRTFIFPASLGMKNPHHYSSPSHSDSMQAAGTRGMRPS